MTTAPEPPEPQIDMGALNSDLYRAADRMEVLVERVSSSVRDLIGSDVAATAQPVEEGYSLSERMLISYGRIDRAIDQLNLQTESLDRSMGRDKATTEIARATTR